jgi:integrase
LRWRNVDFINQTLVVSKSKTHAGLRRLPLNQESLAAIMELRQRSVAWFGPSLDENWFVFPHREGFSDPIPTKPMKGWRTSWRNLTRKAGLVEFRFHDLKHSTVTRLAENPDVSEQTLTSIAGHLSKRMLDHYSHIRMDAKRRALESLSTRPQPVPEGVPQPEPPTLVSPAVKM